MNSDQLMLVCCLLFGFITLAAFGCWGMFAANLNGGKFTGTLVAASIEKTGSCSTDSKGHTKCSYRYYRTEYFELSSIQNATTVDDNYITSTTPLFYPFNMKVCKVTRPTPFYTYIGAYYAASKTKLHTKRTVWRYPYDYSQCFDQAIKDYNITFGSICISFAGICIAIIIFVTCNIIFYDAFVYLNNYFNTAAAASTTPKVTPTAPSLSLQNIYNANAATVV